ncbi:class A beta-lactamase-related serine hydrolase [Micromonospora sp. RHAY321]|uniref:serine hydrolase n=1 Tax=Micromonospora sp. RHAY321 TaxID=2944807 RepID=UPI00207CC463|nr:serine hydrolase [Micromonospora sp. RHAY321]MCO1597402.1 class A beta-lactamase-related serine hydrolase [Micromonospora sp. RHAY321]
MNDAAPRGRRPARYLTVALAVALCCALVVFMSVRAGHTAAAPPSEPSLTDSPSDQPSDPPSDPPPADPTLPADPQPLKVAPGDTSVAVAASVQTYLKSQGDQGAVAVLDATTGAQVAVNADVGFHTASIVKVDILATLLLQRQTEQGLTANERSLAYDMITKSDNNAATSLWNEIGGTSGLAAANRTLGLSETTPGTGNSWGHTTTTAKDQLRLLQDLTSTSGPLNATSRSYVLNLMSQVENDQDWGVPAAASTQATDVYVKNGWLDDATDNGLWINNSVGRIVEPGHDWLVVVLTSGNTSESSGINVVEHAATLAVSGLRAS